jgi:hypothetical protein
MAKRKWSYVDRLEDIPPYSQFVEAMPDGTWRYYAPRHMLLDGDLFETQKREIAWNIKDAIKRAASSTPPPPKPHQGDT